MATYLNHVSIAAPRNATTSHTVTPSAGAIAAGALFTPTAGNFLVMVGAGAVTFTTPTGWTLGTSSINNNGLYVWYRTAAGNDSVTTTHNGSNYPSVFDFYEFPAGSTWAGAAGGTINVGANATAATVTGLTGTNMTFGALSTFASSGSTVTWTTGTAQVSYTIANAATDGFTFGAVALADDTATSRGFAGSLGNAERIGFAVKVAASTATQTATVALVQASSLAVTATSSTASTTVLASETFSGATVPSTITTSVTGTGASATINANRLALTAGTADRYTPNAVAYFNGFTTADFDHVVDVTFATLGEQYLSIFGRATPTPAATTAGDAFAANAYYLTIFPNNGAASAGLSKRVAGTETSLTGDTTIGAWTANVARTVRFQGIGSTLRFKVWAVGSAEPATWAATLTDTSLTAAGRVGYAMTSGYDYSGRVAYVDNASVTTGGIAPTTPTTPTTTTVTNGQPLTRWLTALATGRATWLSIGESLSEGQGASTRANRYANRVAAAFRTRLGAPGGSEYLAAQARVYAPDSTWATFYTASTGTVNVSYDYVDLGHKSVQLTAGATVTFTVTGTAANIWYVGGPGGGSLTYSLDGGAGTTVSSNVTPYNTGLSQRVTFETNAAHTIKLTAGSDGPVIVSGVEVYGADTTSGLRFVDGGWSSATIATPFLQDLATWTAAVNTLAPDLVTIELGGNDAMGNTDPATFKTQALQLIGALKGLTKVPSIVWTFPYKVAESLAPGSQFDGLRAQIAAISAADPTVGLLAFSDTMPQATTSGTGFYSTDGIHPNDSGHARMAALLQAALDATFVSSSSLAVAATVATPTVVVQSASVAFTSTSSVGVVTSVAHPATVPLVQASTLGIAASLTRAAAVALASSSSLSSTPAGAQAATFDHVGTSTLAIAASVTRSAFVGFTSTSTFASAPAGSSTASPAFTQTSTIVVAGTLTHPATLALVSTSTLAVTGTTMRVGTVAIVGTSTFSVAATVSRRASLALVGTSVLAVVATIAGQLIRDLNITSLTEPSTGWTATEAFTTLAATDSTTTLYATEPTVTLTAGEESLLRLWSTTEPVVATTAAEPVLIYAAAEPTI